TQTSVWRGMMIDAKAEIAWPLKNSFRLQIEHLTVPAVPKGVLEGSFRVSTMTISGTLQVMGLRYPMAAKGRVDFKRNGWDALAQIDQFSPEIVDVLLPNRWIGALEGPGTVQLKASRHGLGGAHYDVSGYRFKFAGTRFDIPSWFASI